MSRTSTTVGRRQSIPAWMTAAAVMAVLALALVWRAVPASADTPTTVATVAPTTVATVAPTTAATVAPTTVATPVSGTVSARGRQPSPPCNGSTTTSSCYMELILQPEATPTQDTGWRVGDVIKLELKIKNTGTASVATGTFNGVEAYVDMDSLTLAQTASFGILTT